MQDKENKKTIAYVVAAVIALFIAWEPWRRSLSASNVPEEIGKKLFDKFDNPLAAKSLEIIRFDETNATIHPFKVAQSGGVWSIPSHSNYPADAREHMAQAATALHDIEILGVASTNQGDHELFGVIAPDLQKLKPGMVGVGTEVKITDDQNNTLADLVIGKDVKDQPGLKYVRRADRDQVYRVSIKTDKLSTKFEDWIEKDLLKLNQFDIRDVELNDYSTQTGLGADGRPGLALEMRNKAKLAYDDSKSNWNLVKLAGFDQNGKEVPVELSEDEELNTEKLNDLKSALDDLQIVDVERKPQGLSRELRASDEFVKNREAVQSLAERGFIPARGPGGQTEIYSSEGEATCTTKDGVCYILRFGNLAGGSEDIKDETAASDKNKKSPALNRYLFLTVQFDESQIAKPTFDPVPGDEKPADSKAEPAAEKVPETKTADEETTTEAQAAKANDADAASEAKPLDSDKAAEDKPTTPSTPEEIKKLAVERENKRRQEEYNDAVKKGQGKVKELNDRFADWYFIIPDDVYKKIHLGRNDIVKKKHADADEKGPLKTLDDLQKGINAN